MLQNNTLSQHLPTSTQNKHSRAGQIFDTPHGTKVISKTNSSCTISRKTKILPTKLGKNHERPKNIKRNKRLENPSNFLSTTKKGTQTSTLVRPRKTNSGPGSKRDAGKRSNYSLLSYKSSISFKHFLHSKKGRRSPSCCEFKKSKCSHTLHPIQDGGNKKCKGAVAKERFHGETRFERRVFQCPTSSGLSTPRTFSMERNSLSVPLSMFRDFSRTKNIFQDNEGTNVCPKTTSNPNRSLSRRYAPNGSNHGADTNSKGNLDLSSATARVHNQCKKVGFDTIQSDGISRSHCQLQNDDNAITTEKSDQNHLKMCTDENKQIRNIETNVLSNRDVKLYSTGNTASSFTVSLPPTTTNNGSEGEPRLRLNSNSEPKKHFRVRLVDKQPINLQRQTYLNTPTRSDHNIRCSNLGGLGATCQGQYTDG